MDGSRYFIDSRSTNTTLSVAITFCVCVMLSLSCAQTAAQGVQPLTLFRTSDACMACHNNLITPTGQDVSFGLQWRASMMAHAARDPYWHAAVRRELIDHPSAQPIIEGECSKCHMPMANLEARITGQNGSVFTHLPITQRTTPVNLLAADGVSCALCHQIQDTNLGEPSSFTGGFQVDSKQLPETRRLYGRFPVDAGRTKIMHSATAFIPTSSPHLQKSEMCATCHTLITHAFGKKGEVLGELPEQIPYEEWAQSEYAGKQNCQSCHMTPVEKPVQISSVLGPPRPGISQHVFTGGNFFMLKMFNRYRTQLGVQALPQELETAAARTISFLQNQTARIALQKIERSRSTLSAEVFVENLAGHKMPTAYPSRRVWLQFTVRDQTGKQVFDSGGITEHGAIRGNDNDLDGSKYEPHHREVQSEEDVQIYESIMTDSNGEVTTGLLSGIRFVKDNRVLPAGFDKHRSKADTAVHGDGASDPDFTGGSDRVRYMVRIPEGQGPFQIEVKLWYQPIAYRWAQNLGAYDAVETKQFVSYYDSMAAESAIILAHTTAQVP